MATYSKSCSTRVQIFVVEWLCDVTKHLLHDEWMNGLKIADLNLLLFSFTIIITFNIVVSSDDFLQYSHCTRTLFDDYIKQKTDLMTLIWKQQYSFYFLCIYFLLEW